MNGDVIKSFLVGLGFGVDDASLAKFNKAIATATLRISALYGSIKVTSAAIVFGLSKISEGFEQMGYEYRIIAPAINKALILRRELLKAYAAAGINITKVVQSSVKLNMSLTKTKFAFEAIYRSVASRFFDVLAKRSDMFRQRLYANLPKIQEVLERIIKFIFSALEATNILGARLWSILERVYEFFVKLDKATGGWSTAILGVVAAWKILNLSFLATPLGLLIAGFAALLTLWDDFKTFREGGESLINWGSEMTRVIIGMTAAIAGISAGIVVAATAYNLVTNAARIYAAAQAIVNAVMLANPIGLIIAGVTALIGLLVLLDTKWNVFGGDVKRLFSGIGGKIMDFVAGSPNVSANIQNAPSTAPTGTLAPLVSSGALNSLVNQNVKQQTNITVNESADANATGNAVAGHQGRVNGDLTRNLRGAVRTGGAFP